MSIFGVKHLATANMHAAADPFAIHKFRSIEIVRIILHRKSAEINKTARLRCVADKIGNLRAKIQSNNAMITMCDKNKFLLKN